MTLNQHKIEKFVIIVSFMRETIGKVINRIPGSRLLVSSLPCLAFRTHVESLGKACDVIKRSQSLDWLTGIKRNLPIILYIPHLPSLT